VRESVETPDGDELIVDWVEGPAGAPRMLVLHGLEGSSYSVYVQGLLALAKARGWRAAALNFRSCARDPENLDRMLPNRRPRLYHSGDTGDLDFLARKLRAEQPRTPLVAIGVSLGGNALLKWLGETAGAQILDAAAALSVPYDLAAGSRHMERGMGRLYQESFLRTLRRKAADVAARFPEAAGRVDVARALRSRTFWEFDDAATAPLHGFAGAEHYYTRASSLAHLSRIETPTLCVSSEDDPFLPASVLPVARREASAAVEMITTRRGGHIGFVSGTPRAPVYWAEENAVSWLAGRIGHSA
jgi:predicted alpha/beta-fold hydrolase